MVPGMKILCDGSEVTIIRLCPENRVDVRHADGTEEEGVARARLSSLSKMEIRKHMQRREYDRRSKHKAAILAAFAELEAAVMSRAHPTIHIPLCELIAARRELELAKVP